MAASTAAKADQETAPAINTNNGDEMVVAEDDDDLFELDIGVLHRRDDGEQQHGRLCTAVPRNRRCDQALLANCLLPASSVSQAEPAASRGAFAHHWVGVGTSRRLFAGGRKLGRTANSARFCFSRRGLETVVGNYQRY